VEELRALAEAERASLVIFDEELTPNQGANLEHELKVRVMDRAELILDIFSTRARTHEAKLQVELAQMEYLLPRLARMWTHLSRIRGGIGLRGPGETQLETDRRIIRRKIQALKAKLVEWERHREVLRAGRTPMLSVALVGYTNAGKSSLLRMLSAEHDIFVEDRLFATLDTLTREVDLGEGCHARVSDTVGFIRKLPHHLVASFRATLEEVREADVLLHVVDASHPGWEAQMEVVDQVLADIGIGVRPVVPVFNKMDAVRDPGAFAARVHELYPDAILTTTARLEGLAALKTALRERERTLRPPVEVRIPLGDGARLASLYRIGEVTGQTVVGDSHVVEVRMAPWQVELLKREGVEVRVGNGGVLKAG
jgi:GTP-binding protein HflX